MCVVFPFHTLGVVGGKTKTEILNQLYSFLKYHWTTEISLQANQELHSTKGI